MIDTILGWIGTFLGWLDSITGNYVLAMFLFALVVEIIMIPFGIKQQKNSIKQASLRPKEMAIRNKYKGRNDKATIEKVNTEIQQMYQDEHYNQLSGCLPLLIQLPIILILYNVVINPLQYVVGVSSEAITAMNSFVTAATESGGLGLSLSTAKGTIGLVDLISEKGIEFFRGVIEYVDGGAVKDLTLKGAEVFEEFSEAVENGLPDFNFLGLNLAKIPSFKEFGPLLLVPLLTFLVYFGSMKLNRLFSYQPTKSGDAATDKAAGCSNWMMDIMMPLFSVYISFIVPAAIGVYWIFKSILGTLKQFIFSKVMPMPVFSDEDYKAAEKEYAGKAVKNKEYKVDFDERMSDSRSLFREDASDEVTAEEEEALEKKLREKDPGEEKENNGLITKASLKDDDKK